MKKCLEKKFVGWFVAACEAGNRAAEKARPVPMVVQQHANMMDDSSPVVKQWVVDGGVCGFAWIQIKPGNSPFANWLKKSNLAYKDEYRGGVGISVHQFGQSLERKAAYASAFAEVLREAGVNAYGDSRID